MIKRILLISTAAILFIILALFGIDAYMSYSDADIYEELGNSTHISYVGEHNIRTVLLQDSSSSKKPLIVFSHGAPGSWDAFKGFMKSGKLQSMADLLAYDRPGYGGTGGAAMPSIMEQAQVLNDLIRPYKDRPIILVGHSYGGPIVAASAIIDSINIEHVMMIAPVIVPEHEPIWWFSYFSYWKATKWMLPKSFQTAGSEKFQHSSELASLDSEWSNLNVPMTHIHGEDDDIAPAYYNMEYSKSRLNDSLTTRLFYPDKGHLIIWSDEDMIINQLINIVERVD